MKPRSIHLFINAALLFVPLAGQAYLGSFTRFYADDFCMAADAVHLGLAGMLAKWYTTWTGDFSFILGTGLLGLGGPGFAGWLPAIMIAAWLAALSWAILPLSRQAGWHRPHTLAVIAAGLTLLTVFSTTPNLFQSFYWQDGMANYTLPLIGMTFMGGIILRVWIGKNSPLAGALSVLALSFLSGGFSEVYSAMHVALCLMTIALTAVLAGRSQRGRLLPVLAAALAGGLAAMVVILLAPGNLVRQETTGSTPPGLVLIFTFSIRNAAFIIGHYIIWTPGWALLSVAVPFLAGWLNNPNHTARPASLNLRFLWTQFWFRGIVLTLLAAFGLVTAACAPVVYALNAYPDDRTIIIPQFVLVAAVITASALLGHGLHGLSILPESLEKSIIRRTLQAAILAAFILAAGSSLWKTASLLPSYQSYAQAFDQRNAEMQKASQTGQMDVTVRGLDSWFGVADVGIEPGFWVNRCMAEYYNLRSVSGR